jgi:hypothetical protein
MAESLGELCRIIRHLGSEISGGARPIWQTVRGWAKAPTRIARARRPQIVSSFQGERNFNHCSASAISRVSGEALHEN